MSHILTSDEIAALRSALTEASEEEAGREASSPGEEGAGYAPFRFAGGAPEEGEVRSALEVIFTRASGALEGWMVHLLERDVRMVLDALETMPFQQFAADFRIHERPLAFATFSAPGMAADGMIAIEPGLLFPVGEGIMGGGAHPDPVALKVAVDRAPTGVDLRVAARLGRRYLAGLAAAWSEREPQRFELRRTESDPRTCQNLPSRALVGVARYRASGPGGDLGEMAVVLPGWAIRGLRTSYGNKRLRDPVPAMEARLRELPVLVAVDLPPRQISVRDLLRLRPGDVLFFEGAQQAWVSVEGVPRWQGVIGNSGGRRAVQIQERISGGRNE